MLTEAEASCALQRAWRRQYRFYSNRLLVDAYDRRGTSSGHVRSISFESLVVLLREKPVIAATKSMLQRVHLLTTMRHGSPSAALAPANVNVRVFLAGFMIAYRPTHVFEAMGKLEHELLEAATPLLRTFEAILTALRDNDGSFAAVPHELTKDFPTLLYEYLKRFKAWKVPDEAKLVCRIKHALIALYQAEEHLPPDEPADSKLKLEFRTQIERLRGKLQQIAGVDALAEFDEQRRAGLVPNDVAANPNGRYGGGGAGGAYAALPGRMHNEQLAHELLLDPTFQLDASGGCSVENPVFHRIRESFHQAFWDSLTDDLRLATPCYARVLRVLSEVRDGLKDLAGDREAAATDEVIDLDLIRQQADAGQVEWSSCHALVGAVVQIVQRVQAPARDDDTRDKWAAVQRQMVEAGEEAQPRAFVRGLEFLLDRVNMMRIDAANARLRLISPVIRDHGIDYERGKFQDKLNSGALTLERARGWIVETLRQEVDGKAVELDALSHGQGAAFAHVHTMGMVRLVTDLCARCTPARADVLPETLQLDVHRIGLMQAEFRHLTTASTILIASMHSLGAARNAEVRDSIEKAVTAHRIEHDDEAHLLEALDAALAPLGEDALRRTAMCVLTQSTSPSDPVRRLLEARLKALLVRVMREGRMPTDLRAFAHARAILPRVEVLATRLKMLCDINRTVHQPTYNALIGEATRDRVATEAAAAAVKAEEERRRSKRGGGRRVA